MCIRKDSESLENLYIDFGVVFVIFRYVLKNGSFLYWYPAHIVVNAILYLENSSTDSTENKTQKSPAQDNSSCVDTRNGDSTGASVADSSLQSATSNAQGMVWHSHTPVRVFYQVVFIYLILWPLM